MIVGKTYDVFFLEDFMYIWQELLLNLKKKMKKDTDIVYKPKLLVPFMWQKFEDKNYTSKVSSA